MKNALRVFFRDLKGMVKNPIAIIIIGGMCLVPSLYSFINVIACWDAYSNTGAIPIAIVNQDQGIKIGKQDLNVGNSIVDNLKTNDSIDWKFVNESEANIGLASGKYFAELIIPDNFSKELSSLATDNPTKPELTYKVNTKVGPVANKITEVAQQTLLGQIQQSIMSTLSEKAFTTFNKVGQQAEEKKTEIINLKNGIIDLNENIDTVLNGIKNAGNSAGTLNEYLNNLKTIVPTFNTSLSQIQSNTENISQNLTNTKSILNQSINSIGVNLNGAKNLANTIANLSQSLTIGSDNKDLLGEIVNNVGLVQKNIQTTLNFLNSINKGNSNSNLDGLINSLNNANNLLNNQKTNLQNLLNNGTTLSDNGINTIQSSVDAITNTVNNVISSYNNGGNQAVNNILSGMISATSSATNLIQETQNLNNKIQGILNNGTQGALTAKQTSENLYNYLNQYKGIISQLSNKLQNISDNNVSQIIGILQGNPIVMGDFAQSPFNFKQESIYPVANYGSGMTPVYSVLAFWVGMLITGALLKTEPPERDEFELMTVREKHYGKMLTYIFIAIVQSLIITIGAKFLVGVQVVNLPLFILGSLVTSISFAIIMFTILSIFGHIGDAICIVLMVVQLSGTGGTYPVQAMPMFFRIIEPFVPFPYGVNLMREAIGGPYWPNTIKDIVILVVFAIVFILIGYFVKPRTNNIFDRFEDKFKESGLAE
ncbi:MAG: YhgE/Pip family protein [Clostridium sp.]|uniref:YhgE/Pip domain-containing protein n=1 Tax=Clostridium sp. TaxID=1506 RepID=UPI003EE4D71E